MAGKCSKPYEDVLPVLTELKNEGYLLCMITNTGERGFSHLREQWHNILELFDELILSFQQHILKPDKRMFLAALRRLNIRGYEAIMVGDSLRDDVIGAEKGGIKGILLDRRNEHPQYPHRITTLHQIWSFLDKDEPR